MYYDIEELHESGKMPDWVYYQLNGKTAQENYRKIQLKRQKQNETFILSVVKNMLSATVKTALDEIFKSMKL